MPTAVKTSSLGTFDGVKYFQYDGLFVGKTSTGNYSVPYRISAPANPRPANRGTVLVEPPHFALGTYLREGWLGRPFLFGRRFLHASVGYSTTSFGTFVNRILDPAAQGVFIDGGVVDGNGRTDDEIVVDFARALRSDPVARALIGPAARRYLAGFSDSAEPVKRIVASGLAEDVFDLAVPITTGRRERPPGVHRSRQIQRQGHHRQFRGRVVRRPGSRRSRHDPRSLSLLHRARHTARARSAMSRLLLPTSRRPPAGNLRSAPTSCKATLGSRKVSRRPRARAWPRPMATPRSRATPMVMRCWSRSRAPPRRGCPSSSSARPRLLPGFWAPMSRSLRRRSSSSASRVSPNTWLRLRKRLTYRCKLATCSRKTRTPC